MVRKTVSFFKDSEGAKNALTVKKAQTIQKERKEATMDKTTITITIDEHNVQVAGAASELDIVCAAVALLMNAKKQYNLPIDDIAETAKGYLKEHPEVYGGEDDA